MIFLDTNVFAEALGRSVKDRDTFRETAARALLEAVALGELEATMSEAILAEATQVLTSARAGNRPVPEIAEFLTAVVRSPGLRFAPKQIYRRALALWSERPSLGFVDALTVAYVEQGDVELASFDRQLLASPGVTPYWREADAPAPAQI